MIHGELDELGLGEQVMEKCLDRSGADILFCEDQGVLVLSFSWEFLFVCLFVCLLLVFVFCLWVSRLGVWDK